MRKSDPPMKELTTSSADEKQSSGWRLSLEMNIGRWGLAVSEIAIVVAVVVGVLSDLGAGLSEPPPLADDLRQRAIDLFETHEEWYLVYGRWEDLAVAVGFAGLIVAAPFVEGAFRARHVLVAGAAIAVVGDVIDLSQLVGIDVARLALDNDQMSDFVAGNMYRFGIDRTSTLIWVAGLLITGIGMLIVSRDTSSGVWRALSGLFGVSLIVTGLADISGNLKFFELAQYATAALGLAWIVAAFQRTSSTVHEARTEGSNPG